MTALERPLERGVAEPRPGAPGSRAPGSGGPDAAAPRPSGPAGQAGASPRPGSGDGRPARPRAGRAWVPRVASLVVALTGVIDLVSALTHPEGGRLRTLTTVVPTTLSTAAAAVTAITGLLLLMLARGLRRRKIRAWRGAVGLLAVGIVLHVIKGLDVEEAVISAAVAAGLLVSRKEFQARGDPRTRWRALTVGVGLLCFDVGLGSALLAGSDGRHVRDGRLVGSVVGHRSLGSVLQTVVRGLVGLGGPVHLLGRRGDLLSDTYVALGAFTAVTIVYLLLRPPEPVPKMSADDEAAMRGLLQRWGGRDSLGYFALRRDKSVMWSPSGKSCIAYRVVSGVMLASGDPIGDPEAWPGAIGAFLDEAARHAWIPAVMGAGESGGEAWVRAGLDALEIGDEAIVAVSDFSLEGRPMRNVRQAVNRIERAGYRTTVARVRDIPDDVAASVRAQAAAWRDTETERGFSMALGRLGAEADGECVTVLARQDGELRGFLHFVPWGDDGLSLDLMRRDKSADNGLNELLIVAALQAAPSMGVRRVSLNFAVFRSALERGDRIGAGFILRAWRGFLLFASRWFQIETLYRFNAKFHPEWEPRFVCYPSARELPRIAIAALEAEAFIVWPSLRRRLRRDG